MTVGVPRHTGEGESPAWPASGGLAAVVDTHGRGRVGEAIPPRLLAMMIPTPTPHHYRP